MHSGMPVQSLNLFILGFLWYFLSRDTISSHRIGIFLICENYINKISHHIHLLTLNYFELLSGSFDDAFLFISVQGNWLLTLVIWENWLMVTILKIGTGYSTWWLAVISSVRRELVGNYMFFQITISQWSINVKSPWKWISGHED